MAFYPLNPQCLTFQRISLVDPTSIHPSCPAIPISSSLAIGISSSIADRRVNQPILHSYANFVVDTNLLVLCPVYPVLGLVSVPLHLVSLPRRASYNGLAGNTRLGMTYISQSMYPHPSLFFFIDIYTSSYRLVNTWRVFFDLECCALVPLYRGRVFPPSYRAQCTRFQPHPQPNLRIVSSYPNFIVGYRVMGISSLISRPRRSRCQLPIVPIHRNFAVDTHILLSPPRSSSLEETYRSYSQPIYRAQLNQFCHRLVANTWLENQPTNCIRIPTFFSPLALLVLRWPFKRHQLFHLLYSSSPLSSSGMVSKLKILFCHLDSDFPRPLTSASFHTTSPRDLADDLDMELKFLALDQSIPSSWSASYLRSLSTCNTTLSIAAAAHICINTLFHQPTRRDHPCDHGAPVSDQRQCSPILTSISWSSATFEGLTGPSLSLFMTSWSRIGFCRNERMYLPSFEWFFVIVIYTSSCRLEHSSLVSAPVHIMQEFLVLSRKSADRRANLHIVPKFGLVIPTFSSLSLWFMKPLLDRRHPSSNGSLSQRMSYISSHIHSKYPWILVSSLVMGISPIGESIYLLYINLVVDTDILLSIVIFSSIVILLPTEASHTACPKFLPISTQSIRGS